MTVHKPLFIPWEILNAKTIIFLKLVPVNEVRKQEDILFLKCCVWLLLTYETVNLVNQASGSKIFEISSLISLKEKK